MSYVNTIFKIRVRKRNPQPATFFENHFLMFVVWVDTAKAGLLLVNLPLLYMFVGCLFTDATHLHH